MAESIDTVSFDPTSMATLTYRSESNLEEFQIYKDEYIYEVISQKIKHVRKQRNLSTEEVGKMTGETENMIACAENNCKDVEIKTLNKILDALGFKLKIIIQ